ncbi:hypothetical protein P3S67_027810 [Capsicum chacoense]
MVVKMMKWMSCSPLLSSKKYEAKITVNCLKGFNFLLNEKMGVQDFDRLRVEIKWKGSSKGISLNLGSFNRRSVKKNFTKEECLKEDEGIVEWNEEFLSVCKFSDWKDGVFQPWEVVFTVINLLTMMKLMSCSPLLSSKKYEAKITVNCLKGFNFLLNEKMGVQDFDRLKVEIKWKGSSKGISLNLGSFNRRSVKKNFTKEECLKEDEGIVEWNEEFLSVCTYSVDTSKGPNQKVPVLSSTTLNLADFASVAGDKQEGIEIFIPLEVSVGSFKSCLSLLLNLVELRNTHEASETFSKFIMSTPVSPNPGKALLTNRNGVGSLKAGLQKVIFCKALYFRRHKKAYHAEEGSNNDGRNSVRSEDPDYVYPVDTDSLDEDSVGESEEGKEDTSVQKSFSYESLVYANHVGGLFCSNTSGSSSDEDLVHYNHHISDTKHKYPEDKTAANQSAEQSSKCSLLSWMKRNLSFKYPKTKGEPLLKKHYGEDGADDIGFDRLQLCSSDESSSRGHTSEETSPISVSEFGDESFAESSWAQK